MLDNAIWSALTTRQAHLARGGDRARRYPADMAPFLGVVDPGPESAAAMDDLAEPGETLWMTSVFPEARPGWSVESVSRITQMVFDGPAAPAVEDDRASILDAGDAPEMLALMGAVYPSYFRPRTFAMGTYLGVREGGRIVAMAGTRLCLDGFREISGVATLPEYRGRGFAGLLVARLIAEILREGLVPFLHVDAENQAARVAYEKAGFVRRRDVPLVKIRRRAVSSG